MRKNAVSDGRTDGFETGSFRDYAGDPARAAELIDWYISVFNAKGDGEWGEHWTPDAVRSKLFADIDAEAGRALIATWRVGGDLAGLSLLFVDRAAEVLSLKDLPPACREPAVLAAARDRLVRLVGSDTVVAQYRELGIRCEFRSGLDPVARLMLDPGLASMELGARYVCFWTSKNSRLYPIVIGLSMVPVHDFGDAAGDVLVVGSCAWLSRCLKFPRPLLKAVIAVRLAWWKIVGERLNERGTDHGSL